MNVEKYTDNFRVIASGSFLLWKKDSNARLVLDIQGRKLEVEYRFITNSNTDEPKADVSTQGERVVITCENVEGILGNGMVEPGILTECDNEKIYHNFFVNRPGRESPRMFYYTFYMEVR